MGRGNERVKMGIAQPIIHKICDDPVLFDYGVYIGESNNVFQRTRQHYEFGNSNAVYA